MMFQIELLGLKTAELIIHPEASLRMNMFECVCYLQMGVSA